MQSSVSWPTPHEYFLVSSQSEDARSRIRGTCVVGLDFCKGLAETGFVSPSCVVQKKFPTLHGLGICKSAPWEHLCWTSLDLDSAELWLLYET